jgi:hypothetical protein
VQGIGACRRGARVRRHSREGGAVKLDLYVKKVNQEMIRTGPGAVAGCDYYASWTKSCCILDFGKLRRGDDRVKPGLMLRKEGVGGLVWNPRTGAVYRADEEAYHALLDIEAGLRDDLVARRNGVGVAKVQALQEQLRTFKFL